jgi:predicted dehydrogenase
LRVAIIGLGKMGLVHAGILNVLPDVELVALCEKSGLIRRFAKKVFKELEVVDDLEKLAGLNLGAIYVTTPIPSHYHVAKAIFENEISDNLFVEKTLAQTLRIGVKCWQKLKSILISIKLSIKHSATFLKNIGIKLL